MCAVFPIQGLHIIGGQGHIAIYIISNTFVRSSMGKLCHTIGLPYMCVEI